MWRVPEETFCDGFPTHANTGQFYFNSDYYLPRRFDYVAGVTSRVVARYFYDHKDINSIIFLAFRRVVWRGEDGSVAVYGPSNFMSDSVGFSMYDKGNTVSVAW